MFLYTKFLERTGVVRYEEYATSLLESGLKTMTSPAYTSGDARFVVAKRNTERIPHEDGIRDIDVLLTQFGWDQIKNLESSGIYFKVGRTELEFDDTWYRLTNLNDFGQAYNRTYMPLGILEIRFEKERDRVN